MIISTDTDGVAIVAAADLTAAVSAILGTSARLVNTGGSCGAISATLDSGHELLVTDANGWHCDDTELTLFDQYVVGVYLGQDTDGDNYHNDTLGQGFGAYGDWTEGSLRAAIAEALNTAALTS